jgi:hypothetical protein
MFTHFICIILFLFAFIAGTLGSNFQSHPKFIYFRSSLFRLQLYKLKRKAACNNLVVLINQAAAPPRAFGLFIQSKKICFKLSKYPPQRYVAPGFQSD